MKLRGTLINGGDVRAEALVLDVPFSFIGDFDPNTGKIIIEGHPLFGERLANRILVCPTGKGGTIAPFIAYEAMLKGNAPAAILCQEAEPILCESAITINIPIVCDFEENIEKIIKTGQFVRIQGEEVFVGDDVE